jgi:phosphoribosylglycinamide formyltransferase-1
MRVALLASGAGSIVEHMLDEGIAADLVVVDRPCRATEVAERHGLPALLIERSSFGPDFDRLAYTHQVVDLLQEHDIDLVVMAGWGTILDKPMFDAFEGRVVNTHPALLPAFPGWHAVADALEAGVKVTGCTVHVATLEVDSGPILAQEAVPVLAGDTTDTLHERIKAVERRLYTDTVKAIIERGSVQ